MTYVAIVAEACTIVCAMAMDHSRQIEKRRRIVSVILSLHAEALMVAPKERRPLEPSEEALLSSSKREWERMLWKFRVSLRSLAYEFGRPHQRLSDLGDRLVQ